MILDSSAVVAILLAEPGCEELREKISSAKSLGLGAPTAVETGIVLSRRLGFDARGLLSRFLVEADVEIIPVGHAHLTEAIGAWLRYGKGRHPASLNFGDCMSYATARVAGQPLLCIGGDFSQTDLSLA